MISKHAKLIIIQNMSNMKDYYECPRSWEILLRSEAFICASGQINPLTEETDSEDWEDLY